MGGEKKGVQRSQLIVVSSTNGVDLVISEKNKIYDDRYPIKHALFDTRVLY
jgi:hypothetical protein